MRRFMAAPHRFAAAGNADRKPFLSSLCAILLRSTFFERFKITLNLMAFCGLFWLKTEAIRDALGKEEEWQQKKVNIQSECIPRHGEKVKEMKNRLIDEINALGIEGMPKVEALNALVGSYVNLAYPLPSGISAKFLDDKTTYLGNQLKSEFGGDRCFGVLANMDFILVCTYEAEGKDPELVLYKKR